MGESEEGPRPPAGPPPKMQQQGFLPPPLGTLPPPMMVVKQPMQIAPISSLPPIPPGLPPMMMMIPQGAPPPISTPFIPFSSPPVLSNPKTIMQNLNNGNIITNGNHANVQVDSPNQLFLGVTGSSGQRVYISASVSLSSDVLGLFSRVEESKQFFFDGLFRFLFAESEVLTRGRIIPFERLSLIAAFENEGKPINMNSDFGFAHFTSRNQALEIFQVLNKFAFADKHTGIEIGLVAAVENKPPTEHFPSKIKSEVKKLQEEISLWIKQNYSHQINTAINANDHGEAEAGEVIEYKKNNVDIALEDEQEEKQVLAAFKSPIRAVSLSDETFKEIVDFRWRQAADEVRGKQRRKKALKNILEQKRLRLQAQLATQNQNKQVIRANDKVKDEPKRPMPVDLSAIKFSMDLNVLHENPGVPRNSTSEVGGLFPATSEALANQQRKRPKLSLDEVNEQVNNSVQGSTAVDTVLLRQTVDSAIVDVLGEADEGFAQFVISKIKEHSTREQLVKDVQDVLDEDSEDFVNKLKEFLS